MSRTDLPEKFDSYGEYERHVKMLVDTELIENSLGCPTTRHLSDSRNAHRGYLHALGRRADHSSPLRLLVVDVVTSAARQPTLTRLLEHACA